MMKKAALCMCALAIAVLARGQTISPEVYGAAGTEGTAGTTTVAYTIGEPLVETVSSGNAAISQGFHQPRYVLVALEEPILTEMGVKVYPNPATDFVFVEITRDEESELNVQLIDMSGKILAVRKSVSQQDKLTFDLSQVSLGNYFLRVIPSNGQAFKAYQVNKIQ